MVRVEYAGRAVAFDMALQELVQITWNHRNGTLDYAEFMTALDQYMTDLRNYRESAREVMRND